MLPLAAAAAEADGAALAEGATLALATGAEADGVGVVCGFFSSQLSQPEANEIRRGRANGARKEVRTAFVSPGVRAERRGESRSDARTSKRFCARESSSSHRQCRRRGSAVISARPCQDPKQHKCQHADGGSMYVRK
jgi:hypothetical protein